MRLEVASRSKRMDESTARELERGVPYMTSEPCRRTANVGLTCGHD